MWEGAPFGWQYLEGAGGDDRGTQPRPGHVAASGARRGGGARAEVP